MFMPVLAGIKNQEGIDYVTDVTGRENEDDGKIAATVIDKVVSWYELP